MCKEGEQLPGDADVGLDEDHEGINDPKRVEVYFVESQDDISNFNTVELDFVEAPEEIGEFEKIELDFVDVSEEIDAKPLNILIVDDNDGDVFLIKKAFEEQEQFSTSITVENCGDSALSMLREPEMAKPDVILLDINIPRRSGKEILKEIKTDQNLKDITVIMLSSSKSESDIRECVNLMADGYMSKPCDISNFSEVISIVKLYSHN